MKLETWPLAKVKPWEDNPRTIAPGELERLKRQIEKLGMYKPLIVHLDGTIIGGNMRYKALKEMGVTEVGVSIVDAPTDDIKLEYALSDNDQAGTYDESKLVKLVQFTGIELDTFKVNLGEPMSLQMLLDRSKEPAEEDDAPAAAEGEPESKLGEIYELGRHRLMCGDATDDTMVDALMGGVKADMVFTDPPYGVDYVGKTNKALKIENDKLDEGQFYDLLFLSLRNAKASCKSGASIYVCHADSAGLVFRQAFIDAGWDLKQCIIWVKQTMVMGRQDYQWKHEPILYGWAKGGSHYFIDDRTQTTVWNFDRPTRSTDHPTMKPVALIDRAIRNSSKGDDIVLDLFGGSGSTLIAAEKSGRTCYMMELDPRYCDVVRKRYEAFMAADKDVTVEEK